MTHATPKAENFRLTGWTASADAPEVRFAFACDEFGAFGEVVRFPSVEGGIASRLDDGVSRLITLLHIALGVSYYKCAAAPRLYLPEEFVTPEALDMARHLYTAGLAEFFVRADLPYPPKLDIIAAPVSSNAQFSPTTDRVSSGPALVAFGGGKDSYVARAIMAKADATSRLCSVVMSDKVRDAIQRTAPEPVLFLERKLDPRLSDVNAEGAFNGHVPITAINSLMLVILGRLTNSGPVVFANERSADEPTITQNGLSANHQYSKSSFFEEVLRKAIQSVDPAAPDYFSVLRPFSELWIARAFASLKEPFDRFTSCNRNFVIKGDVPPRWCGKCAKCAFTYLLLAPHLTPEEAATIFPENFLIKEDLLPIYRELLGLSDSKPWDCVGTINECRVSLWRASDQRHLRDYEMIRALLREVSEFHSIRDFEKLMYQGLADSQRHFVPQRILEAAHALA